MTKNLRVLAATVGLLGAVAFAGTANAGPIGVTNATVNIWHYLNPTPGNGSAPCEQALATNPCAVLGNRVYTGTYTGPINFTNPGSNNIAAFLNTAGGAFSGSIAGLSAVNLSNGGFTDSTLMEFIFNVGAHSIGTISHDDGISVYDSSNTKIIDSSAPTVVANTTFDLLPGTYSLWYSEVNGLPAQLVMDVKETIGQVPEPASLALLALGLLGIGFSRRKQ